MAIRIIISPAKTMNIDNHTILHRHIPDLIDESQLLLDYMQGLSYEELKSIWKSSDRLARLNYSRIREMDLRKNLTPALLAFEGLQYKYMGSHVFTEDQLDYLDEHLRILSGFYGVLRPFDGVVPYRLEMGSKLVDWHYKSVYDFWGDRIGKNIFSETDLILDLASKEYSKVLWDYLGDNIDWVECVFGEIIDNKIVEKATYAKMARGQMVRFMAEIKAKNLADVKKFKGLGYSYREDLSSQDKLIFIKGSD